MRSYRVMMFVTFACLGISTAARAQTPIPGQPYQIPDGYTVYGPGTLIAYGGSNYVIQSDGTMLLQQPAFSYDSSYGQPGGAGYSGDSGSIVYDSSYFQLGIGVSGNPGTASKPGGQANQHPGWQGQHQGGQNHYPAGSGLRASGGGFAGGRTGRRR
jgi:hypothetical protein